MSETAGAPARKRTTRKRRTRKSTTLRKSSARTGTTGAPTGKRRGRPPGSKTRRTSASNPADALTKRIQALVNENVRLQAQVKELEKGLEKIEKALGTNVARARRAVRKRASSLERSVRKAIG